MNFNDVKVRQAVWEHITFAVSAVTAAIPDVTAESSSDKMVSDMTNALRNPIIMQVLQFSLNLDYRLKNSLLHNREGSLDDEPVRTHFKPVEG